MDDWWVWWIGVWVDRLKVDGKCFGGMLGSNLCVLWLKLWGVLLVSSVDWIDIDEICWLMCVMVWVWWRVLSDWDWVWGGI